MINPRVATQRFPHATRTRRLGGLLSIPLVLMACGSSGDDATSDVDDTPVTAALEADEPVVDESVAEDSVVEDPVVEEPAADEPVEEAAPVVEETSDEEPETDPETTTVAAITDGVNPDLFFGGAISGDPVIEDCTLSGGAETTCYTITVSGYPTSYEVGPFCPTSIEDGADAGGIWFDGDAVYDLDGQFFVDLPTTYNDDQWQMYDADGNINVTETAEEFENAARPDVDESLQNHCVEGQLEFLENGEPITSTVQIPTMPVMADSPGSPAGNSGVTLDGVVIAEAAPVDAILGAYTIAAFDDCGAHFNPFEGYHMHGAVGCSELGEAAEGDTAMFGYAMDGYPIHSPIEGVELDECNGHTTEADGYHYHANSAEQNEVISCLIGQTVAGEEGGRGGPPG